jgi:P27 family predicted phage terminase small subunit
MGKRGLAPKPTALRLLHGDRESRINRNEPIPPDGPPVCPAYVSDEVREIWDYTLANLIHMGIATPADRDALLCYCEAVVTHRRASELLKEAPLLVSGAVKGTRITNPAVRVQRDAAVLVKVLAQEFGFTPSARSEIHKGGASNGPASARYLNA